MEYIKYEGKQHDFQFRQLWFGSQLDYLNTCLILDKGIGISGFPRWVMIKNHLQCKGYRFDP